MSYNVLADKLVRFLTLDKVLSHAWNLLIPICLACFYCRHMSTLESCTEMSIETFCALATG